MNPAGNPDKPHFHVAAGVLVESGRILVTRRPEGVHLEGLWEFPGGKQEQGETLEACLERELLEELGLRISAGQVFAIVHHEYTAKFITLYFFLCRRIAGRPAPLQGQEIRWVSCDELRQLSFPPPDTKVVDMLTRTLA